MAVCSSTHLVHTFQGLSTCWAINHADFAEAIACRAHQHVLASQGLLICLTYVPSDVQNHIGQGPAIWRQSFATVDKAQQEVLANAVGWSPPGTLLAALSTFTAALQSVEADNTILLLVCLA